MEFLRAGGALPARRRLAQTKSHESLLTGSQSDRNGDKNGPSPRDARRGSKDQHIIRADLALRRKTQAHARQVALERVERSAWGDPQVIREAGLEQRDL